MTCQDVEKIVEEVVEEVVKSTPTTDPTIAPQLPPLPPEEPNSYPDFSKSGNNLAVCRNALAFFINIKVRIVVFLLKTGKRSKFGQTYEHILQKKSTLQNAYLSKIQPKTRIVRQNLLYFQVPITQQLSFDTLLF